MFPLADLLQWLLYFYIYCFLGWVFESCYVSARQREWVNRGFLRGPLLPIYGSGAVMMLVVSEPVKDNLVLTYFAGVLGATALEYVTGAALEALFKVRYWDYSDQRFNFRGHICLSSSVVWGFFTIGMNEFIHPGILKALAPIPLPLRYAVTGVVSVCFACDTVVSVRGALDLRDILMGLSRAKEEMERLQRRMDVVIAFADDGIEEFKKSHPELLKLEESLQELKEHRQRLHGRLKKHRRRVCSNPSMRAPKLQKELGSLKELILRK